MTNYSTCTKVISAEGPENFIGKAATSLLVISIPIIKNSDIAISLFYIQFLRAMDFDSPIADITINF